MHVLQVTPRYFPNVGGVDTVVQKISETLVENSIDVTVYTVDSNHQVPRQQRINQVLVKRFSPLLGDPFFLPEPKFIMDLQREKADIIHVHNVHTIPPFIVALAKDEKQKMVLQPHYHRFGQTVFRHSLFRFYKYALRNIVFPSADVAIANSAYEERALREDFPGVRNTILLPEGMDTNETGHVKHDPVEPNRILYVGSLRRYKNVDKIIDGFSCLLRRGNKSKLVIVGDGPEYKFLASHARNLGVDSLVEWKHGLSREELLNEYARASVFILLSHLESFSRATYDALLIGVPVVVLNFGALEDLVRNRLAIGVNSLNPEEIAGALLKATGRSPPRFPKGTNTFLDWPEYSKRIIDTYYELLEDK